VSLPIGGLHDFGERGTLAAGDHVQDLRALALDAWGAALRSGFMAFLVAFAPPFALAPLAVFLGLGAPFFWLAAFLAGAFSGATCAACAATVAALSVALVSAFVKCV
jgi:hypothetical protein